MKRIFYVFWCVIFSSMQSLKAQDVAPQCILAKTNRFVLYKSDCQLTVSDVLSNLMKRVFDSSNDSLILSNARSVSRTGQSILTYDQVRYGYKTRGYARLFVVNDIVEQVEYRLEAATISVAPNFINVDIALSTLKDSLGFDSFTWEPFEHNGISYFVSKDTAIALSAETVNVEIYSGTDSSISFTFPDTTWLMLTGDPYPQIDTVLTTDSLGVATFEFNLRFRTRGPGIAYNLLIDATDGSIIRFSRDERTSSIGTGMTLYNSYQEFYTKWMGPLAYSGYILLDDVRGHGIHTKMYDGNNGPYDLRDPNNLWYGYNIGWDGFEWSPEEHKQAISAHWAVEKSWDYFYDIFELNSIDNEGRKIEVLVNVPYSENSFPACNASFNNSDDKIRFGQYGSNCDAVLTLDITGHEFTHGVSKYAVQPGAGFNPVGESGALDESFSDIFGCMIEYYTTGPASNWSLGDQLESPPDVRHMNNPNSNPNPNYTMGQPSWYGQPNYWLNALPTSQNDWGGIHINSGVQNHWFYLLSEGGPSPQPGNSTLVQGIGREKAALIAYRNLTEHMMSNSNYADARVGSILAAVDEFTACSFEVEQTINAWDAVNVSGENLLPYDVTYSCTSLSENYVYALRDLDLACDYSNESNHKTLTAGRILTLEPGFESNSNMHIRIEPCLAESSGKQEGYPSYAGAGSVDNATPQPRHNEEARGGIVVFPNPNNGSFAIRAAAVDRGVVYDMMGRQVASMKKIDDHTLFISSLGQGAYVVRAQLADGRTETARVVVY